MSEERRSCPLQGACLGSLCAWWDGERCAVVSLSVSGDALATVIADALAVLTLPAVKAEGWPSGGE